MLPRPQRFARQPDAKPELKAADMPRDAHQRSIEQPPRFAPTAQGRPELRNTSVPP